jgi:hypothetical protein
MDVVFILKTSLYIKLSKNVYVDLWLLPGEAPSLAKHNNGVLVTSIPHFVSYHPQMLLK